MPEPVEGPRIGADVTSDPDGGVAGRRCPDDLMLGAQSLLLLVRLGRRFEGVDEGILELAVGCPQRVTEARCVRLAQADAENLHGDEDGIDPVSSSFTQVALQPFRARLPHLGADRTHG